MARDLNAETDAKVCPTPETGPALKGAWFKSGNTVDVMLRVTGLPHAEREDYFEPCPERARYASPGRSRRSPGSANATATFEPQRGEIIWLARRLASKKIYLHGFDPETIVA